jgi:hypothetical protein
MYRILINELCINKQEFSASSWRSNQGYTKMHGQPTTKEMGDLRINVSVGNLNMPTEYSANNFQTKINTSC